MPRVKYDVSDLISGIVGSPDEVGYDISISKTYDDIRNARFEEDGSVSFGIWERALKKADWEEVERLSVEALKEKSKDFQIVGWLIESLVVMDGFQGVLTGIQIIDSFIRSFWSSGYPRKEDNSSDFDQKFRIIDWIFDTVGKRIKFVPFANHYGSNLVNLYHYEYSQELKSSIARSPTSENEIVEAAKKDGHLTQDEVNGAINAMSHDDVDNLVNLIHQITEQKQKLDATFLETTSTDVNSFSSLISSLEKVSRLVESHRSATTSSAGDVIDPIQNGKLVLSDSIARSEIYDHISELSRKLAEIEKHSPSSFILNLVVSWKDKTLLEIMDDLKTGNSEAHRLLKFLIN